MWRQGSSEGPGGVVVLQDWLMDPATKCCHSSAGWVFWVGICRGLPCQQPARLTTIHPPGVHPGIITSCKLHGCCPCCWCCPTAGPRLPAAVWGARGAHRGPPRASRHRLRHPHPTAAGTLLPRGSSQPGGVRLGGGPGGGRRRPQAAAEAAAESQWQWRSWWGGIPAADRDGAAAEWAAAAPGSAG